MAYLRARDPSVIAWNCTHSRYSQVEVESASVDISAEPSREEENIQVFLRLKNCLDLRPLYEIEDNILISKLPAGKDGVAISKKYSFSKIFEPDAVQSQLFNCIVKPRLLDFINGKNFTLLTYGVSGSGKTYTIVGTDSDPGLIPRSLEYLFNSIREVSKMPTWKPLPNGGTKKLFESDSKQEELIRKKILSIPTASGGEHEKTFRKMQQRLSLEPTASVDIDNVTVDVWISFAEIYNEYVYDLLVLKPDRNQQRPKLRLGNVNGNVYIKDLTSVNVSSGVEAYEMLQYGLQFLNYAATSMNAHSSRSHCIFTIKLVQAVHYRDDAIVSCFNFCDLAGSERLKKSLNVGDRLKESNNINTSLLVLHRCIKMLRDSQKRAEQKLIPYRESKLTQLFQRALSGCDKICMIVNVNPIKEMFDESQHVLTFSAITKDIVIQQPRNIKPIAEPTLDSLYEDEEIGLYNSLAELELSLEEHRMNNMEIEQQIRLDAANDCELHIQALNKQWDNRYRQMVDDFEAQIDELNLQNENESSVINLDDTIDDIITDLEQQLIEEEARHCNLNAKVKNLTDSLAPMQEENDSLQAAITNQNQTISDLKLYTKELKEELIDMSEVEHGLLTETREIFSQKYELQEKIYETKAFLAAYKQEACDKREFLEQLEEEELSARRPQSLPFAMLNETF